MTNIFKALEGKICIRKILNTPRMMSNCKRLKKKKARDYIIYLLISNLSLPVIEEKKK